MSSAYNGFADRFLRGATSAVEPDLGSDLPGVSMSNSAVYLEGLAALSARSFSSNREALRAILEHAAIALRMRSAFLAQLAPDGAHMRVLAAYNAPGGCGIIAGAALPARPPFAEVGVWARSAAPVIVGDMRAAPGLTGLLTEFPSIGSYIGVPLVLSGGQLFGTLCVADPLPHNPVPDQATLLAVLARIAAGHVEIDRTLLAQHRAEEALELAEVVQEKPIKGKTAELIEARERLEEQWKALLAASPDGIALVTLDNTIMLCNEQMALLTGASNPDELIGHDALDFVAPEDRSLASINVGRALDVGAVKHAEWNMLRNDGTRARVEVNTSVITDAKGKPNGLVYIIHDVTPRLRSEERLNKHFERLAALRNIDMAITVSHDLKVTLNVILYQVAAQLRVDAACVLLLDPESDTLNYSAGRGFRSGAMQGACIKIGEGHAGRAAMERRIVSVPRLDELSDFSHAHLLNGEEFISYFAVPLQAKNRIEGVLEIFHRAPMQPEAEWLDFLEALSSQAAIAIDNARMFEDLQRSNIELALAYDTTLEGWSRALDLRDRETEGHTRRVTESAVKLARILGVAEGDLVHLRRGALLHDIGKMGIPDGILLKPGPLNDDEWAIMRRHPKYAHDMLSPILFLTPALDIPYCHHEKWDGTGYPRGLKGEEIPLSARIFAVVDVFDALRSTREYHAPWPEEQVLDYIRSLAGSHFDPAIVRAFLEMKINE